MSKVRGHERVKKLWEKLQGRQVGRINKSRMTQGKSYGKGVATVRRERKAAKRIIEVS